MVNRVAIEVDGCGGDRWYFPSNSSVDEFAKCLEFYQSMTPSPTD